MSGYIGPALPPHLRTGNGSDTAQGIGPSPPPGLQRRPERVEDLGGDEDVSPGSIGPALPPHLQQQRRQQQSRPPTSPPTRPGPSLPPGMVLPEGRDEEEEGEDVGPMPVPAEVAKRFEELSQREALCMFEQRASGNKQRPGEDNNAPAVRETWMLELPEKMRKNFGSGPRQFKRKYDDHTDDGGWTDTPNQAPKEKPRAPDPNMLEPAEHVARDDSLG
jgi:hypothetical protein